MCICVWWGRSGKNERMNEKTDSSGKTVHPLNMELSSSTKQGLRHRIRQAQGCLIEYMHTYTQNKNLSVILLKYILKEVGLMEMLCAQQKTEVGVLQVPRHNNLTVRQSVIVRGVHSFCACVKGNGSPYQVVAVVCPPTSIIFVYYLMWYLCGT